MSRRIIILTIGLLLLVLLLTSINSVAQHPGGDPGGVQTGTLPPINGYSSVGITWEDTITEEFDGLSIESITFDLSWTDDEGSDSQPDTFSLQTDDDILAPKSGSGSGGSVSVSWDDDGLNNVWNIAVTCDSAGPTQVPLGPLGLYTQPEEDLGNSWTLVVTYTYTVDTGVGGPPQNVLDVLNSPIFKVHIALMIASTYLFLGTGIVAGIYLYSKTEKGKSIPFIQRHFSTTKIIVIIVILAFIAFFLAAVPIGMWVAGGFYGWTKAWTGFPALWNPEAFELTNADNVSFIVLLLWAIPVYLNRRQIVQSKWYKKLFGWSKFLMARAEKAPNPKLQNIEFALSYFFMGFMVYLVFMVQPHGSG